MKIIIIEDEALVAEDLAASLKEISGDIEIIAELVSVEDAIDYLSTSPEADLIFSDIALNDGLSFEIFQKVNITIPVIFCTAYDEYAMEAFKANGIEYILKPFDKAVLEKALKKFATLRQSLSSNLLHQYEAAMEALTTYEKQKAAKFMVRFRNKVIPLDLEQIALFYVEDDLTYVYTFKYNRYVVPDTLDELEKKSGASFFRVNRQFLINRNAIQDASSYLSRKLSICLVFPFDKEIIVSKEKKRKLLDWLVS